jgi:glycosyltransferase involved in cell wall biosynthesis
MSSVASSQPVMTVPSDRPRVRLLAIIEASTVTGPAKNLLEFCRISRELEDGPIVEASILTFQRTGENSRIAPPDENEFARRALRDGIPLHRVVERFAFDWRVLDALKQVVDRVAPDIIQTHGIKSHFLVRACRAHQGRGWVAFHHGYTTTTYKYALLAQLDRWSLRAPSQVVAVSQAFSRRLVGRGVPASRITVLHNAADPEWLRAAPSEDQKPVAVPCDPIVSSGEKLVLAVGRLSKEKSFTDLVLAIRHLRERRPELAVRLVIVGEGREREAIEESIRREGLQQQVSLVGHVQDVRPYYRAADLLAISSLSEGSPNALLEAMAAGVPVVATAIGGIPEIVTDQETALLVRPHDPASLALAIEALLVDPVRAEKIASRARDLIRRRYSPLSRTRSLVQLYQQVCVSISPGSGACECKNAKGAPGHESDNCTLYLD